jgi:hypothetical protein
VPLSKDAMRNPWKDKIPTFTTTSNIMCRKVLSSGQLVLRRIHPLECLRLQGWDMSMWSETVPPIRALGGPWGQEELQDLVGNMWMPSLTLGSRWLPWGGGLEVGSGVQKQRGQRSRPRSRTRRARRISIHHRTDVPWHRHAF